MTQRTTRRFAPGARGFTLIELVIAMVVTALMILVIMMTFTAQNQLYRRQSDIGRTQQSLRLAMEIVSKDISLIGFGAGVAGQYYGILPASTPNSALDAIEQFNEIPAGSYSDALSLVYIDPDRTHWGFIDQSAAGSGYASDYRCGTTQLRFSSATVAVAGYFSEDDEQWDQIVCFSHSGNLGLGVSYIWAVSGDGDSSTGIVTVDQNSQTDYEDYCDRGLPEELICGPLVQVSYYIDRDGDGNGPGTSAVPYLMMSTDDEMDDGDDIPIAAGIEDLQFGFCELTQDCDAQNWVGNHELADPYNFANLSRVRIRMTARSERQEEQGLPASTPVILDPNYTRGTAKDTYHRRVAHQVINIQNARSALQIRDKY
jgi:prepilin-type N-terminal cleavage/methylation domain-containing protein